MSDQSENFEKELKAMVDNPELSEKVNDLLSDFTQYMSLVFLYYLITKSEDPIQMKKDIVKSWEERVYASFDLQSEFINNHPVLKLMGEDFINIDKKKKVLEEGIECVKNIIGNITDKAVKDSGKEDISFSSEIMKIF